MDLVIDLSLVFSNAVATISHASTSAIPDCYLLFGPPWPHLDLAVPMPVPVPIHIHRHTRCGKRGKMFGCRFLAHG